MVKLILKSCLLLKVLSFCLITKNILSVRSQEIPDCAIVREAVKKLGSFKLKFVANNCCDLDVVTCNANNVIGIKLIGISCFSSNVKLEDTISEFANLKHLESFELSYQSWCKAPTGITNLKNLKSLVMTNNGFKETLPEYFIKLNKLEKLDLSFNKYYGTIPNSYRKLKNLKSLILNNNELSGSIPYSFIKLENLTELNLAENKELTGYIPELPKINTCDYASTDLCSIKSSTCTTNLKGICTEDIITNTDKSNGKATFNNDEKEDELEATNNNNDDEETNGIHEPNNLIYYTSRFYYHVFFIYILLLILFN
ncbi:L domain-like protein [Neocallimastix lanati (nom. inval.)]|jgi:Leucine-rich repeat (LRR) protein|uniref:L domain-like protein n=1 Tax=Neocallimastix californiae TaxID=1754190 RepID=A0A1Y2ACM9_9FUNG|nr:L domain-like protein [Neocallimastix sp. JGI-2020a]ORY20319.1 L domain-like protein [Neocallimastix californiae]|eukprot:ORY20319.1 L domain-like protein [Neocallimastix californiae]